MKLIRRVATPLFVSEDADKFPEFCQTPPSPPPRPVIQRRRPFERRRATMNHLCRPRAQRIPLTFHQCRQISNSPYGRTHVWKRRAPVLPKPLVPKFPQRVVRSDGTSFTQWTTSPKSLVRLTRDTTNNPMYNFAAASDRSVEEESGTTGRLGRFNRRFEELGSNLSDMDWMEDSTPNSTPKKEKPAKDKS